MKTKTMYYDGTNLLNMKDEEGKVPNIFISLSGRSYGKTTWFYNYMLENALEGKKFILLTRNKNDINGVAQNFVVGYKFKEYKGNFEIKNLNDGIVKEIDYTDENDVIHCLGYVLGLSTSNKIKQISKVLEDGLDCVFFDEFIVERGSSYLTEEVYKLQSVLQSVFRNRYYKVILCANLVSSLCPLFGTLVDGNGMCITEKLEMNKEAKRLRGIGWVLEIQEQSDEIKTNLQENNRAFSASNYSKMSTSNEFMDDKSLVDKSFSKNKMKRICDILFDETIYELDKVIFGDYTGMFYMFKTDLIKCSSVYTMTQNNINTSNLYIGGNSLLRGELRQIYDAGYIKFDSLSTKAVMVNFLKYDEL